MSQENPASVTTNPIEMKYGEREIINGELITFPNPRMGRRYTVDISLQNLPVNVPFLAILILPQLELFMYQTKKW